jgi:hypothetical protein
MSSGTNSGGRKVLQLQGPGSTTVEFPFFAVVCSHLVKLFKSGKNAVFEYLHLLFAGYHCGRRVVGKTINVDGSEYSIAFIKNT